MKKQLFFGFLFVASFFVLTALPGFSQDSNGATESIGIPPIASDPVVAPPIGILPPEKSEKEIAKTWMNKINRLYKDRKFALTINESADFLKFLNTAKDKTLAKEYKPLVFDAKGNSHESIGEYVKASVVYQHAYEFTKDSKWVIAKIEADKNHDKQATFFGQKKGFLKEHKQLSGKLVTNAEKKNRLVDTFIKNHAKKPPTKEQMTKLRTDLKKIVEERKTLLDDMTKTRESFQKVANAVWKDGIRLNNDQNTSLASFSVQIDENLAKSDKLTRDANEKVLKIAEQFKQTWPGLLEAVTQMNSIMTKLSKLQDEFIELSGKKPLTDADLDKLRHLKQEIAALTKSMDKLLEDLVEAFMNSEVFANLTDEQQNQLLNSIVEFFNKKTEIDGKNERIEELWLAIKSDKIIGDLNKDGFIDKEDLAILHNIIGRFPIKEGETGFSKSYDFDGNGVITMTDYYLLTQAVNGARKFFPIDPECQVGDWNGDGKVNETDVLAISNHIIHGINPKTALGKIADFNKDGKTTLDDVIAIAKHVSQDPSGTTSDKKNRVDVNGDGKFDFKDLQIVIELAVLSDELVHPDIRKKADINGDGKINVHDIIAVAGELPGGDVRIPVPADPATYSAPLGSGSANVPASDTSNLGSAPEQLAPVDSQQSADDIMSN
ncbi:MAG: hypothetical protein HQM10_13400 [Candidatus Riflebacteria bacterium]|nr:hypothetical protein [Candidatus Riflebacteria bacterium]